MLAVAKIDYSRFREIRVGVYSLMIAAISLVFVFGAAAGSRRWIELPYFRFQPSELAKVLLIVALAAFVIERTRRGTPIQQTLRVLALGLTPAALIFLQPDLGTGIVLVVITLAVLFLAGLKWSHFAAIGGWRRLPSPSLWSSLRPLVSRVPCAAIRRTG
jgi:rod shape determining protein RodA